MALFKRFDLKTMHGQDNTRDVISNAYKDAALILGKPYTIYRPSNIQNMLDPSNIIGQQNAYFSLNWKLNNESKEPFQQYICFSEMDSIQPGDILNDGNETFIIVWNRALDQIIAYKAEALVEIWRADYSDKTNGLKAKPVLFMTNVPASISSMPSVTDFTIQNVRTAAQAPSWDVRIWTDREQIQASDQIRRTVDNLWLMPMSIQNNKHYQILGCRTVNPHGQ